jgi:hypothetical protein
MCSMLDSMTTREKSGFDTTTDFLASRLRGRRSPVGQALRMVNEFRRSAAFGAQRLAGRMRRVGFEAGEAAVFNHCDAAAPGDAQSAVAVDPLRVCGIGHRLLLPVTECRPIRRLFAG